MATFNALDIIKDNANDSVREPISLFIQQGEHTITTDGCFKITSEDCIKQGAYSLVKSVFHPRTKASVKEYFDGVKSGFQYDQKDFFDSTSDKTDLHLTILGLFELSYGAIAFAYNRNKAINLYYYHIENNLHPCYASQLAHALLMIRDYGVELEKQLELTKNQKI